MEMHPPSFIKVWTKYGKPRLYGNGEIVLSDHLKVDVKMLRVDQP